MKKEDFIGLRTKEVKEILDKKNLRYQEDTKKKLTFKEPSGNIVEIKEDETGSLVLYESNRKVLIFIIILASLVVGLTGAFGNGIYESIKDQIIEITGGIGAPELEAEEDWGKERIVKVVKDAKSSKKLAFYEYCVKEEKSKEECKWEKTYTKNTQVGKTGIWEVIFRGVDIEGKRGKEASKIVKVDNNSPEITNFKEIEVKEASIKVKTEAKDNHSGIEKYMYSLDGVSYSEGKDEYTYSKLESGTEYRIYVKVIDKVGNESIVSILVKTELSEAQRKALEEEEARKRAEEQGIEKDKEGTKDKEEQENETEKEWDIPKINLDEVPNVFELGDNYDLPSYYSFGNDEGKVVCLVDDEERKDTSELTVGKHTIICTATSKHKKEAIVEKEVLVQIPAGEIDEGEIWDGWLKLNLYYPEESYNWQWRYGLTDNDIDEEDEEIGWEDYTGPILVKIEDIPRIYIRYDMNGKTYIVAPAGQVLVDIEAENNPVSCGGRTTVKIEYDEYAKTKEYRLNGGKWQEYEGPFEVYGNTQVEARATKDEEVYNNLGEYEYTQELTGRDIRTVGEVGCSVETEPQDPILSLGAISSELYLGEDKSIPSYYSYGTHGEGKLECIDETGKSVINTRYMSVGNHTVTCSLETQDGIKLGPVRKTFTIVAREYNPEISLWDLPSTIVKGDNYKFPNYYTYGSHGAGNIVCEDGNGNEITNTSGLEVGTYNISCVLTTGDGRQATTARTIKVVIGFEPFIDLNNIPDTIYLGDFYSLPSHYNYGRPNVGTKWCKADGVTINNTHSLSLGSHNIECEIVNGVGQKATTSRIITVIKRPIEKIEEVLTGPIISINPTGIVTEADVVITPQEKASVIKYSYDNKTWNTYSEPFEVDTNRYIYAYYVRESDGKISQTSYYRVKNIKTSNLPYVRIDTEPGELTGKEYEAMVSITASDYDTLEYSLDGIIYKPYTGSFRVTNSSTVYARATNSYGTKEEKLVISLVAPPIVKTDTLFVKIVATPDGTQGYKIKETEISILHSDNAEEVYYKLGVKGKWQEYTGPFTLEENTTVYAYAVNAREKGNDQRIVNFLTTGIANPLIVLDPEPPKTAPKIKVHIDWGNLGNNSSTSTSTNNATASISLGINKIFEEEPAVIDDGIIRKYRIIYPDGHDSGWLDWTGDFEVEENCRIEAYQEDSLGHKSQTAIQEIENVVPAPQYTAVDKGDYYLLRLNYPSTSKESDREYKWKDEGTWKKYDSKGILLIKPKAASKYDLTKDGVEIEDEDGNKITIDIAHVYVLDVPVSEISGNIFMRWDNTIPDAPTINVNKTTAATEVEVTISYPKQLLRKYYKIVSADGEDSGWQEYSGPIKITKNNTTIYAKGSNRLEISSDTVSRTITNIDEEKPEINVVGDLETAKQKVNLTVTATDDQMLYMVKWAKGRRNLDYFNEEKEDKGTTIKNGSTVQVESNGWYTFYAVDQAGNEVIKEIEVTNIDLTAPDIVITVLTSGITTQAEVSIDYGDSKIKQYSIGDNASYENYTDVLTISSYDYFEKANPDGTLTIYAKGKDEAGNITEVSEIIRCLDLDKIADPIIVANGSYPTITSTSVELIGQFSISYDTREGILNEISLDNGATWNAYTGNETFSNGTIMARSRRISSGLTTSVITKEITQPVDSLGYKAYNQNEEDYEDLTWEQDRPKKLYIADDIRGKKVYMKVYLQAPSELVVRFYRTDNSYISSITGADSSSSTIIDIPQDAAYMTLARNATSWFYIYEIMPYNRPTININYVYPTLNTIDVEAEYENINITYFPTAVTKQYSIDNGEWKNYTKPFKLYMNQTVQARSIDKDGNISILATHDFTHPIDSLGANAYNQNEEDFEDLTWEQDRPKKLYITSGMRGQQAYMKIYLQDPAQLIVKFYKDDNSYISSITKADSSSSTIIDIPQDAAYMTLARGVTSVFKIYEIMPHNRPVINVNYVYPTINVGSIEAEYENIDITYFKTAVIKQYKIDNGEWQTYTEPIKLYMNQTVQAQSIDKDGNISILATHTFTHPADSLGYKAYNQNEEDYEDLTWEQNVPKKIYISSAMQGQQANMKIYLQDPAQLIVKFYKDDDSYISSITKADSSSSTIIDIPQDAAYMTLARNATAWFYIYEITPIFHLNSNYNQMLSESLKVLKNTFFTRIIEDILNKKVDNPIIEVVNSENAKLVTINIETEYRKEYSIDLGTTWLEYKEPFEVTENITILTRVVDNDNKVLSSSTYTITSIVEKEAEEESTNVLPSEATNEKIEESVTKKEKPEETEGDSDE